MSATLIKPSEVKLDTSDLIDVRSPAEFRAVHARGARNIPLDALDDAAIASLAAARRNLVLICKSGTRAGKAATLLQSRGLQSLTVVEGGTDAWSSAGLPVEKSAGGVISLERQVRIGAGSLVLLGVILGFTVHPGFFGLSGFVGCGLIVAGITDWCGMGILLAKLPWNR